MHETLSHFHEPQTEAEAHAWLIQFLLRDNSMQHRTEAHTRLEDWLQPLPPTGLRAMGDWERFWTFAREPERRKVGIDARGIVEGGAYTVEPALAGDTVVLWWGLFDQELYVEHEEQRYGPSHPMGGPIPLHRSRRCKKTAIQQRVERLEALAAQLLLPRAAVEGSDGALQLAEPSVLAVQPFVDPDPFQQLPFPTRVAAKWAIADSLGLPLAKLPPEPLAAIDTLLTQTLQKQDVLAYIRTAIPPTLRR